MTRDDESVFAEAFELTDPAERAAFLDRACAGRPELRRAVEGLLAAYPAGQFLEALAVVPPGLPGGGTPRQVGDYRVVREVGRGGMGVVYEAVQESLGRRVALKVLPFAAVMDPRALQRFENEARAAAALDHPHVVKVYGVGQDRGVHFIALQFVDGRTLADLVADLRRPAGSGAAPPAKPDDPTATLAPSAPTGPMDTPADTDPAAAAPTARSGLGRDHYRRVAEWGAQAADALEHAHALGVVHRDVKPGNLMVDARGHLWVTDFGLAQLGSDPGLTHTDDLLGTPRYMSPEQAAAKHNLVDHRTDVYSLGATLYELLTLQPPFPGRDRSDLLRRIAAEEPRRPGKVARGVPPELETVVLKAMDKSPGGRYQSAGELAADLRRFLEHRPVLARPAGPLRRAAKWARRHPARAAAAALLLAAAAAAGLAAGATRLWLRAEAARGEAAGARETAEEARGEAEAALGREREARAGEAAAVRRAARVSYLHRLSLAHHAFLRGDLARADRLHAGCPEDLRGWEWAYLGRLLNPEVLVVRGPDGTQLTNPAFSPDGKRLAYAVRAADPGRAAGAVRGIRVVEVPTGREARSLALPGGALASLAYSPDGSRLAAAWQAAGPQPNDPRGRITIWQLDTGREVGTINTNLHMGSVRFSPDGGRLIGYTTAGPPGTEQVRVWDVAGGKEVFAAKGHSGTFLPGGRRAAVRSGPRVGVWDLDTAKEVGQVTLEGYPNSGSGAADDPAGRRRAVGMADGAIKVWALETGKPVLTVTAAGRRLAGPSFSPDGRFLAATVDDGTAGVWDAVTGQEVASVKAFRGAARTVAVGPGGRHLAAVDGGVIRLYDTSVPVGPRVLRGPEKGWALAAAFSSDGGRLAWADPSPIDDQQDHRPALRVWDLDGWREVHALRGHTDAIFAVACSPDGRLAATGSFDRTARVWDLAAGRELHVLKGHTGGLWGVAFSRDGRLLATASADGTVKVWDPHAGRELATLRGDGGMVHEVAFAPDGRLASTSDDGTVRVWDPLTGGEVMALRGGGAEKGGVAYSPDGKYLATAWAGDPAVRLWDAATGRLLRTLPADSGRATRLGFGPDGRLFAAGGEGGTVLKVWDPETGEEALSLAGERGRFFTAVAVDPTGRRVAAPSTAGTVTVWDAGPPPDRPGPVAAPVPAPGLPDGPPPHPAD